MGEVVAGGGVGEVPGRRYGGLTAEERRAERRARLTTAATEIWVAEGWAAVSMRAVCARAGLTDRYFYEEFRNVDDLLGTLRDEAEARALRAIVAYAEVSGHEEPRTRLAGGVTAFVTHLATHPDDAHVLHGDSSGCEVLVTRQRLARVHGVDFVVAFAEPYLDPDEDREALRVLVRMGLGGLLELIAAWQAGDVPGTVEDVVGHAVRFCDLVAASLPMTLPMTLPGSRD